MSAPDSFEYAAAMLLHEPYEPYDEPEVPDEDRLPRWACTLFIVGGSVLLWAVILGVGIAIGMALAGSGP